MANYTLLASESTVQVLSPTVVNDVVYATIATSPSAVIASTPVPQHLFLLETVPVVLENYAASIEVIMAMDGVISGSGTQTLDASGLLADAVTFVCQYVPSGANATAITATAVVPASELMEPKATSSGGGIVPAEKIITDTLARLKSMAGD